MSTNDSTPPAATAPTIIHPVIGLPLWYWPTPQDRGEHQPQPPTVLQQFDQTQPCDGRIVYVHSDRLVNVIVTDHVGANHALVDVKLHQEGDELLPFGGYATWTPSLLALAKEAMVTAQAQPPSAEPAQPPSPEQDQ